MFRSVSSPGSRCLPLAVLACWSLSFPHALLAQNPPSPTPAATAPAANPASTAKPVAGAEQDAKEVSSQDTPATFKVRVNNVLVRVVVRDSHGKVVSNLKKEDFQLYDGKKLQTITRSEEHTSELQSPCNLVCRLLLEKKKKRLSLRPAPKLLTCLSEVIRPCCSLFIKTSINPTNEQTIIQNFKLITRPFNFENLFMVD